MHAVCFLEESMVIVVAVLRIQYFIQTLVLITQTELLSEWSD